MLLRALAVASNAEFLRAKNAPAVSRKAVYLWMDHFCQREPLSPIVTGIDQMTMCKVGCCSSTRSKSKGLPWSPWNIVVRATG